MAIAIIDCLNQDIGLKILFPSADYFVIGKELTRDALDHKYGIKYDGSISDISDKKYDILFVVCSLYDSMKTYKGEKNVFFKEKTEECLTMVNNIINKYNFKAVCFFDNYDYDYDPNIAFDQTFLTEKNIIFFKRNYSKNLSYKTNVFSFPYIMFGYQSIIDIITSLKVTQPSETLNRLFFSGSIFLHKDDVYGVCRDRNIIHRIRDKLQDILYIPGGYLAHSTFMEEMTRSRFCLDLLGVGDPNIRTFEILSSGSLWIHQKNNLVWPFEENFDQLTEFEDENDLYEKIKILSNEEIYQKCLTRQNFIVKKYMTLEWIRNYIKNYIGV